MNELTQVIRQALETSSRVANACVFPTILADWPSQAMERTPGVTRADIAISYLSQWGFKCDRTRMDLHGYPGLLRELTEPPPWIEVTPEDVEGPLPLTRENELRPLYIQANETPADDLICRFRDHIAERQSTRTTMGLLLSPSTDAFAIQLFKEKIELARCLGASDFESLYDAVFDLDAFSPASGAPDLFVWDSAVGFWFFAEVKGPHDHLRKSQADWVRTHWDSIKGRFVLLAVAPDA